MTFGGERAHQWTNWLDENSHYHTNTTGDRTKHLPQPSSSNWSLDHKDFGMGGCIPDIRCMDVYWRYVWPSYLVRTQWVHTRGGRTRVLSRGRYTSSTTCPLASVWLVKVPSRGRYTNTITSPRRGLVKMPLRGRYTSTITSLRPVYDSWRCPYEAGTQVLSQACGQYMTFIC